MNTHVAAAGGAITRPAADTPAARAFAYLRRAPRPTPHVPAPAVVETTVASADEADAAVRAGASRLLLCAAPEVGGLTPTVDALRLVQRRLRHTPTIPVAVLIRPRLGGHEYTRGELAQMRRDASRLLAAGASGIAFGAVRSIGGEVRVDRAACEQLVAPAREFRGETTFHLALDDVRDRQAGLRELIALGFDRVHASGGIAELAAAVGRAGRDIEVVPAAVEPGAVGYVVAETGCRQVLVESRTGDRAAAPLRSRPEHTPLNVRAVAEAVAGARPGRGAERAPVGAA